MKLSRISDGENIATVTSEGKLLVEAAGSLTDAELRATPVPVSASASDLLMYAMKNEFEEMNKNLKIIIKHLSFISDQEIDKED